MIKSVHLCQIDDNKTHTYYELSDYSFFIRRNVKEIIDLLFKKVVEEIKTGHDGINNPDGDREVVHRYNSDSIEGAFMMTFKRSDTIILAVARDNTDDRLLRELLRTIYRSDNPFSELETIIKKFEADYSNNVNKIANLIAEVDEVKGIMKESIEKMIARGDTLESLITKSDELSVSSKVFIEQSKKLNKCCLLL
jgi:synaptobrevin homolog YKT6